MTTNISLQDFGDEHGVEGEFPETFEVDVLAHTDAGLQLVAIRGNEFSLQLPDVFPTEEAANEAYFNLTGDQPPAPNDPNAIILDLRDTGIIFK
jgi:hypothetical protein